jgi:hypothetical protein
MGDEANLTGRYRQGRRDFIAACQAAGADAISRVHPARAPDGGALFCDSAALGPRDAARALLLIGGRDGAVTLFLQRGVILPEGARLVAVHALDPFAWAWGRPGAPAGWSQKTLAAIAAEDLAKVKKLTALDMDASAAEAALAAALPRAAIAFRAVKPEHSQQALRAAIAAL